MSRREGPSATRSGFAGRDARAATNRDPSAEAQAATARGAVIEARLIEAKPASATVTLIADSAVPRLTLSKDAVAGILNRYFEDKSTGEPALYTSNSKMTCSTIP